MKNTLSYLAACSLAAGSCSGVEASAFTDFVKVEGDQLTENGKPFRFISFNVPNLHLIEDNLEFAGQNAWRLPDRFEITDALESVRQMGGTVARTYVISVVRTNDQPGVPRHVTGPGQFNETAFRALDEVLLVANQTGVRIILPLVDNWSWWGGRAEYASFRGKGKDAFWSDPQIINDFKQTIRFVLERTNSLTGVAYRDDKAILGWETGNELESTIAWTREIAAYIKSLDHNHPVIDCYHNDELRQEVITMPEIDIVSTHHYPGKKRFSHYIRANSERVRGKKPYFIGEFGFVPVPEIVATLETTMQTGISGALVWSLRSHNRDGGFYWHSESGSGQACKAYHWPGFSSGDAYGERELLAAMRRMAFEIRGLPVPPIRPPESPRLLGFTNAIAISWQGSAGASSYLMERATNQNGPWRRIAVLDDASVQYRPLFTDVVASNENWFYRICASNSAGCSKASNIVGPVNRTHVALVDEMADFSKMHERTGTLEIKTNDCRKAQEDAHRLAGQPGSAIVYKLPAHLIHCQLDAYLDGEVGEFHFSISTDGKSYQAVPATQRVFASGGGEYGYLKPVRFELNQDSDARFLKIEFGGQAQVSRVQIDCR